MTFRRREVLAAGTGSILLVTAGCIGDLVGSDDQRGDDFESSREKIVDSEVPVAADASVSFSFVLGREATLEYEFTVDQGPRIEVFVLDEAGFEAFQSGNGFDALSHGTGADGSGSVQFGEGSYRLVLDHSDTGDLEPASESDAESAAVTVESWIVR